MKERLFLSLREQLKHEISFITNVSRPYSCDDSSCRFIDFDYRTNQYQLVLNGNIYLKTNRNKMVNTEDNVMVESYHSLIRALIKSRRRSKVA